MKKYLNISSILLVFCFLLVGCGEKIPSKDEVLKYTSRLVSENYGLCNEWVDKTSAKNDIYHYEFKSNERNLEFEVTSTLTNQFFDEGPFQKYEPRIESNYAENIRNYYKGDVIKKISQSDYFVETDNSSYFGGFLEVKNLSDLTYIYKTIYKVNEVLSEELKFNDERFLKNNFLSPLELKYEKDGEYVTIARIVPNGLLTQEEIQSSIYVQVLDNIDKYNLDLN